MPIIIYVLFLYGISIELPEYQLRSEGFDSQNVLFVLILKINNSGAFESRGQPSASGDCIKRV